MSIVAVPDNRYWVYIYRLSRGLMIEVVWGGRARWRSVDGLEYPLRIDLVATAPAADD